MRKEVLVFTENEWLNMIPAHGFSQDQIKGADTEGFIGYYNGCKCYVWKYIKDPNS